MAQFEELNGFAILEKAEGGSGYWNKVDFWEDLNFLRASLQLSHEDNLAWTAEETGNPLSYSD